MNLKMQIETESKLRVKIVSRRLNLGFIIWLQVSEIIVT